MEREKKIEYWKTVGHIRANATLELTSIGRCFIVYSIICINITTIEKTIFIKVDFATVQEKKQLNIPIRSDMYIEITVEPQIKHQLYIHNKIGLIPLLHRIIITNLKYL